MGITPTFDTSAVIDTRRSDVSVTDRALPAGRVASTLMRFGGLAMDTRTGATQWGGRAIQLSVEERETLANLMRRAGQIVNRRTLATALNITVDKLDERIEHLRDELRQAGATCLPCRVDGLGYVLWRC
jgi:DNA-binding response OmpR family regulator